MSSGFPTDLKRPTVDTQEKKGGVVGPWVIKKTKGYAYVQEEHALKHNCSPQKGTT